MWDQNQSFDGSSMGAGGFMLGDKTPGGGEKSRKQRANNIVPVSIADVLTSMDETFMVEEKEVGMVVLVGQVVGIEHSATKSTFRIQDKSGEEINCVHWIDEGHGPNADITEDIYCRIVGSVRVNKETKSVMVFKISKIADLNEVDAHSLEIAHAKMKIRQLKDKENAAIFGNANHDSLSNSMVGGFSGGATPMSSASANVDLGGLPDSAKAFAHDSKHLMVYKMLFASPREEGLNRNEIFEQLKGKITQKEIENSIEYLSNDGHIYSTIDDDHYAVIER